MSHASLATAYMREQKQKKRYKEKGRMPGMYAERHTLLENSKDKNDGLA
jgi:hypothetical protein